MILSAPGVDPGPSQAHGAEQIAFGAFRLDLDDERLLGPAGPVKLGHKAYRVLLSLAEEEGRLVTKDTLFSTVWDGTIVSESALTSVIKELRRALGDDSRTPEYIESVYGRGYRMIPAVTRSQVSDPPGPSVRETAGAAPAPPARGMARPTAGRPAPSLAVAVLPFDEEDGAGEGLGERIADDVAERLTRLRWLPVVAPGAVHGGPENRAEELGAELGVRYLVSGRLHGESGRCSITVTLSSTETGRLAWSRRIEPSGAAADGSLSAMLVELIAALSGQIEDQEMRRAIALPDEELDACDLVWRARWHSRRYLPESSSYAEALLERAMREAPHSGEALIQLANCRLREVWRHRGGTAELLEVRHLAQRAINIDEWDGRGYLFCGIAELLMRHSGTAIALLEQAIDCNPSLGYAYSQLGSAHYLRGRPDLALPYIEEAIRLHAGEHHAHHVYGEKAMVHAMLEQWDAALATAERAMMHRLGYWYPHVIKVHALVGSGDLRAAAEARAQLQLAKSSFTPEFIDWLPFLDRQWPDRLKESLRKAELQGSEPGDR